MKFSGADFQIVQRLEYVIIGFRNLMETGKGIRRDKKINELLKDLN